MQLEVTTTMKLTIHATRPFKVDIGSGENFTCDKVCKEVQTKIQGITMKMDIFLIPMSVSNVVIGIQWLKRLGYILSNYETFTMKFKWEGRM